MSRTKCAAKPRILRSRQPNDRNANIFRANGLTEAITIPSQRLLAIDPRSLQRTTSILQKHSIPQASRCPMGVSVPQAAAVHSKRARPSCSGNVRMAIPCQGFCPDQQGSELRGESREANKEPQSHEAGHAARRSKSCTDLTCRCSRWRHRRWRSAPRRFEIAFGGQVWISNLYSRIVVVFPCLL